MELARRSTLTRGEFLEEFVRRNRPVLLTDAAASWPALGVLTPGYLSQHAGDAEIAVEVGDALVAGNPQAKLSLREYVAMLESGEAERRQLYAAGLDLFALLPEMRKMFDFSIMGRPLVRYERAWLGARGTVSAIHRDVSDNILCQLYGRKVVKLAAPSDDDNLYISHRYDYLTVLSEIDIDHWDPARHPRFAHVDLAEVVLEPGSVLFIPTNWWHYTRALDTSISVNSGGATMRDLVRLVPYFAGDGLHRLHLYRWGNCACHPRYVNVRAQDAGGAGANP